MPTLDQVLSAETVDMSLTVDQLLALQDAAEFDVSNLMFLSNQAH